MDTHIRKRPPRHSLTILVLVLLMELPSAAAAAADDSGSENVISIGIEKTLVNALIYIADERGFFADNDITVTIDDHYPSGAAATADMLNGKHHFSTSAELMLVRKAFLGESLRALASIDMFTHMKLVARRDLGINAVDDLKGKKIGVPFQTAAEFKLDRFLRLHGIDREDVSLVNIQAPEAVAALSSASVDALVTWQPHVMDLTSKLSDTMVLDVQNSQPMYCLFFTRSEWAGRHPQLVDGVIQALLEAEEYVFTKEDEAREILRQRLGYNHGYMQSIWAEHRLSLRLDQSLILALEDQARWMIEAEMTTNGKIPDFLEYIDPATLNRLNPEAVSIIH